MGCFSASEQKTSSESKTSAQKKAIDAALGQVPGGFEGYGSYLGQGMNVYPGQRVAPMTGTQTDVLGQLPDFASAFGDFLQPNQLQGQMESTASQLLQGQMGAQPITPEAEASFFQRGVQQPAMKQFREETLPGVREEFAGPGYWGMQGQTKPLKRIRTWVTG